jgi:Asp-tRNA(Asn)/Glu-tRNA(Gln) amidotransferase A subunit family amidase
MGSSGSSAGSAAAVAAGGVVFAIGSETLGSIISPSVRCGVTAVRPSFGRVSRAGAMALCWSMDKLGPMARSFADAGLVLSAISGAGERELDTAALIPAPWPLTRASQYTVGDLKVGVPRAALEAEDPVLVQALDELRQAQAEHGHALEVVPFERFNPADAPLDGMLLGLMAEAAAAFDELTRSGKDDELVSQDANAWPNLFRAARLIPAVEYINAQRHRTLLIQELDAALEHVDLIVHPPFAGDWLTATNLTGHPTLVAPLFLDAEGRAEGGSRRGYPGPKAICFTGRLYDEGFLLAVAERWQGATDHHRRHPDPLAAPATERSEPEEPARAGEAPGDR